MNVSVVINTYNRCRSLGTTLESLRLQTHSDFEVVVVNGPSTDGTDELLDAWGDRVVRADCPVVNISVSRNIGIANANGDVVAFIDDDAIPEPDWLAKLVQPYADPRVAGAGGIVWDHTGMALQYRYSYCDHLGRTKFTSIMPDVQAFGPDSDRFVYLQGTNASFRRTDLASIGGFDEEIEYFHDETDVAARLHGRGRCLIPLPDGAVHHRYLASHLRSEARTILEPYSIVKNSWYFALINGASRYPRDVILNHLQQYTHGVREHGHHALARGRMSPKQHDYFLRRVDEGLHAGLARGSSGERKLATFAPANPERFRRFATVPRPPERLTICFVSKEYPPDSFGGIGRFTKDLAEGLAEVGHQVHVVTTATNSSRIDWENGVWLHRIAARPEELTSQELRGIPYRGNLLHCAAVYKEVRRLNKRFPLDIVSSPLWSSEGLFCQCDDALPTVLTLMTSQKTIGHIDPSLGASNLWKQQVALERQSVRRTRYIHAISQAILDMTLHDYGPTAATAKVAYLGVRDEGSRHARRRPAQDGAVRILCVGRLEPRKGTDLLLAAARQVCQENPRAQFVLVGKDSGCSGKSYREEFESLAPELVAAQRVVFAGEVTDDELYQHYADADVFVLPSRFESLGLVLLEALSFGLPLIATRVGGIEEIVHDGQTGLLFDAGSTEQLVDCLRSACGDDERRRRMRVAALRAFSENWSLERAVERTAAAYLDFARDFRKGRTDGRERHQTARERLELISRKVAELGDSDPLLNQLTVEAVSGILCSNHSVKLLRDVSRIWYRGDRRFITKTFRAILGREPDEESIGLFKQQLKQGASRIDIVRHIVESEEGRSLEIPLEWVDRLPKTEALEKLPIAFPIWGFLSGLPSLLGRNGPLRQELRRHRTRRALRSMA
jgi:glycogen(starch) synthase